MDKLRRYLYPWSKSGMEIFDSDVLVLGSGIAGLYMAIKASQHFQVTVLTKKTLEESNTEHAQGGIAVAIDEADSPTLHFEDTLRAGAGLCDPLAVRTLVEEGPTCVDELMGMGAQFDRQDGELALTREAAHSHHRILHALGDATGWEIERALVAKVKECPKVTALEGRFVVDLLENYQGEIVGALVLNEGTGELEGHLAKSVVLATGGSGQVYSFTTNPSVATGDGMAVALRAGANLMDMDFVQFHPTALLIPKAPRFLIWEVVRGPEAQLDGTGTNGLVRQSDDPDLRTRIQALMWNNVGILRDEAGLEKAAELLLAWERDVPPRPCVEDLETANMLTVGVVIARAAKERLESRGAHNRTDYPLRLDEPWQKHSLQGKKGYHVRYVPVSGAD